MKRYFVYFGRQVSRFRETSYFHLYVLSGNTEEQLAFTATAGKISAPAIVPSRLHRNSQSYPTLSDGIKSTLSHLLSIW